MGGLLVLLSLSTVMAIASFLAGVLPLSISLSQSQLRMISTVGMGVLVGTSLIVIIPEGIETLYKSNDVSHGHSKRTVDIEPFRQVNWARSGMEAVSAPWPRDQVIHPDAPDGDLTALPGPVIPDSFQFPPTTPTEPGRVGILDAEEDKTSPHTPEEEEHRDEAHHAWIGVALISGFILMFLIDKVPQLGSAPKPTTKTHNIAMNDIGRRFNLSNQNDDREEAEAFIESPQTSTASKRGSATTIGLVIHAAADGIALGASSSTSHTSLSLIIFFAVMIHKAPAAFGLTSILLRQGLSKRMVRAHLVLFSMAAPVGAILTWMVARLLGSGAAHNASNTAWWTGILLLFSAGTFLYVAMHSMQEVLGGQHDRSDMNGHVNGTLERRDSSDLQHDQKTSWLDIAAAVFGMILPLFLQVRHTH